MKPQIFILHYAGGNSYSFQKLVEKLRPAFEVEAPELPGRGRRINEPLLLNKKDAIADLLRQIREKRSGAPFVVFGHSMGASLGFHIVKELEALGDAPTCFIASGNPGPNVKDLNQYAHLPRDQFFSKLREMGGITDELSANEELLEFFEPILRADFALLERKEDAVSFKIKTPIHAIMGNREEYVQHIENWRKYTSGNCQHNVLEGNHFFVFDHLDRVRAIIEKAIKEAKPHA